MNICSRLWCQGSRNVLRTRQTWLGKKKHKLFSARQWSHSKLTYLYKHVYPTCLLSHLQTGKVHDTFWTRVKTLSHEQTLLVIFQCKLKKHHQSLWAKLGNIVAKAKVSQFSRALNMCCRNKFCCSETKSVFASSQKHFCFPDINFVSATYVPLGHRTQLKYQRAKLFFTWNLKTGPRLAKAG